MANATDFSALLGNFIPPGVIMPFAGVTAPSGWLVCDGSAISRTTYAALFSAISTVWGYGDNSTTFNLPDMRGRFLRGVDNGIARDPDRASRTASNTGGNTGDNVGTVQEDATQGHYHSKSEDTHNHMTAVMSDGNAKFGETNGAPGGNVGNFASWSNNTRAGYTNGNVTSNLAITGPTTGAHGLPKISTEARGKNANVNYIIKI